MEAAGGGLRAIYVSEGGTYYSPIVTLRTANANWTYLRDGMESVRKILNDSQTSTDAYSYEAFGNITSQAGSTVNPFRYVGALGYYTDQTTKLYHVGARYYSPQVGRFWTQDPVKHPGVNAYPYVASNPTNTVDPDGHTAEAIVCVVVADPEPITKCCVIAAGGVVLLCWAIPKVIEYCKEREQEKIHVRCKRGWMACVSWCKTLGYPQKGKGWKHPADCKDACDKARRQCENRSGDTSVFPGP
jgi:RHS repeat-associated protein